MSFGSPLDDDSTEMSDINMTPLIDVMLVLLIIFMITLPVITHSVQVDLPKANNEQTNTKPDVVTLTIDKDGNSFWNDTAISSQELEQRLAATSKINPQPEIHIRGDKKVEYQYMIKAMAAAQKAGLTKLGFITEPEASR